jgi:hypothetical protein
MNRHDPNWWPTEERANRREVVSLVLSLLCIGCAIVLLLLLG